MLTSITYYWLFLFLPVSYILQELKSLAQTNTYYILTNNSLYLFLFFSYTIIHTYPIFCCDMFVHFSFKISIYYNTMMKFQSYYTMFVTINNPKARHIQS
jgi:hypothetical protein